MYYTVTVPSSPQPPPSSRRRSSVLRWQYASTLTKTQATMRKSTVHCPTYYNITYLGELLEHEDEEEDATEEKTDEATEEKTDAG